ncbi:MAG: DUF4115 domain-containing protein [Bacteroidetes bacterium]|nr:DUF4115 domain-containing protein [Bacteroidota bacterium]
MIEFGTYLRKTRESAGLSLQDMHDRTRISLKNLRLIESGDFPSIPQTYVRAFVREYARTIGLDEDDVIHQYNEHAEREKGIPPPPEAIDSSNLLPRVDDTVEFVLPSDQAPSHVEVEGTAEVQEEMFEVPVRKSSYVREGDAAAIDIRTTAPKAGSDPERRPHPDAKPESPASKPESPASKPESPTSKPESSASKPESPASKPESPASKPESPASKPESPASKPESPASKPESPVSKTERPLAAAVAPLTQATAESDARSSDTTPPDAQTPSRAKGPLGRVATATRGTREATQAVARDAAGEKRIIGVGMVVIAMIGIAIYGVVYFSSGDGDETTAVDSTSIKASIEAGRFIDSSQYAMTDMDLAAEDTASAETMLPPEPVEARPRVFAREDSLVLEAFSSAPVWFSVKMDTLRTERGSLSSNEHRVWKARDHFVITLGDAGAVTFFLNGKEIGTLGEEGAVVKNVSLSRQQLNGN